MNCFVKSHGLGNDYIVLDSAEIDFDLGKSAIELICHRNYGIGSDGILLLVPPARGDFGLRILNPDGSEAEKAETGSGFSQSTSTREKTPRARLFP